MARAFQPLLDKKLILSHVRWKAEAQACDGAQSPGKRTGAVLRMPLAPLEMFMSSQAKTLVPLTKKVCLEHSTTTRTIA
jgi:hypothetical protein